jgi:hypothetical protein
MARENLRYAARTVRALQTEQPKAYDALVHKTALEPSEVETWIRAAEYMYVPYDEDRQIVLQDDSFLDRELWDFRNTPPERYPLLLFYHPLNIYRKRVIKQADVVLGMFLLGDYFPLEAKKRNFNFYDPLTTGDSSLSSCIEAIIAALAFYLFVIHTATAGERSFLNRALLRDSNCVAGTLLMFLIGIPLYGTMTLLPTMMQSLMNYPVITAGFVTAPRGIGTMLGMIIVTRLVGRVDVRLIIFIGMAISALSLWQMTGFSLQMGMGPFITTGVLQGFGLGFVFTQLSVATFSTLPRSVLTQGSAMFSLMRNIGGSVGISIVEALLVQNTQIAHATLSEHVRPDNPLAHAPYLGPAYSLTDVHGIAALNHEITRQAQMIAYIDNFHLMVIIMVVASPFLLLLRRPRRAADGPRVTMD